MKYRTALFALLCILSFIAPSLAAAKRTPELVEGKIVGIADADTLTVLVKKDTLTVRLHGIDSPESGQPFGAKAKKAASELAFGKVVKVEIIKVEKYKRVVGRVTLPDGTDLSEELVRMGFAWWYQKYAPSEVKLGQLQDEARKAKRGLWSDPHAVPPWTFRRTGLLTAQELSELPAFVGNKKSKIYWAKGCSGYMKILDKNRVPFSSARAAEEAWYRAARDCEGMKKSPR
jgi:micrococcal nuclease